MICFTSLSERRSLDWARAGAGAISHGTSNNAAALFTLIIDNLALLTSRADVDRRTQLKLEARFGRQRQMLLTARRHRGACRASHRGADRCSRTAASDAANDG